MRALIAALLVVASVAVFAQPPGQSRLRFDVASVKPSAPGGQPTPPGAVGPPQGGNIRFPRGTLRTLLEYALGLQPLQRHDPEPVGGPDWADKDQFDIVAKGPADLRLVDARRMMLSLLEDRFGLRVHVEQRDTPVYALVMAGANGAPRSGLKRSSLDCGGYSAVLAATGRGALAKEKGPDCGLASGGAPALATGGSNPYPRGTQVIRGTATLTELITALSRDRELDRPVVDHTGLVGTFDVDLHWVPARSGAIVADPADVLPLVTAVQEQLGLRLDPRREPHGIVVIDSAERPMAD